MVAVALVGTLDTKGPDFAFLADRLRAAGAEVITVDVGTGEPNGLTPDIDGEAVAAAAGTTRAELREAADRGRAVTAMGRGAASVIADLVAQDRVGGVLAAGGSGGSSIAAQVMAALPVRLPKLLVSTMASGDVSPYVGAKDVCLMYSVVDVAGINRISRLVLGNAAAAMAGMVAAREQAPPAAGDRPLIAASMFGVTTPAVEAARDRLAGLGYEVLVFHATGAGGRALEALAEERLVSGVLDLTTTELADDLVGGVLSAGPDRLTAAGAACVPQVIAPGALDMVNFGPHVARLRPAPGRRDRRMGADRRMTVLRRCSRPLWDPRAHRSGRCYPVVAPARAQLPAVSVHSDDPSVADHDPAPRVAFCPGYEIGLQLTTPAVRVPVPPKPADRGCGRLPQLLALVGCGHRGDKVDRPLAVKEVKRAHVDDHRPDQAARVADGALEDRPHIYGTPVRLTLLAGQRVHRLTPDLRVLVIEGAGQRRCRLWREVDPVQ